MPAVPFGLSVITDEISQDFAHAARVAQQYGCTALEIRSVDGKGPHGQDADSRRRIRAIAAEHEMAICSIASPFGKCDIESERERREHLDILKRCCDFAHEVEAPTVRCFTFYREKNQIPEWDRVVEHMRPGIEVIEEAGLTMGIENEPVTSCANAPLTLEFLTRVAHPQVKSIWDPGNDCWCELPDTPTPYPDGYALMKPHIAHVHVKDYAPAKDGGSAAPTLVGSGLVDWVGQFRALINDGFNGYASLETHWRPTREQMDEMSLKLPGGADFSEGGEAGSRLCFQAIKRLLDEASS